MKSVSGTTLSLENNGNPPVKATGASNDFLPAWQSEVLQDGARIRATCKSLQKEMTHTRLSDSYAWTSPYGGFWVEHYFSLHFKNFYGKKIVREGELRKRLQASSEGPEIMLMGNFIIDRSGIVALCRTAGINLAHGEDGFFPHYETMHVDPLGFCWESSLPRMVFRRCSDIQRLRARNTRRAWLKFRMSELPQNVRHPFVLWPLQLTGDKVNQFDLNVTNWADIITHFRSCLPLNIQLVLKEHPRGNESDMRGLAEVAKSLPNTLLVSRSTCLKTLLHRCSAAAGANSSVLYEARLMFHKPVYAYARSWFTNHGELFMPVCRSAVRELSRIEHIEQPGLMRSEKLDDYTDWFTAQLLARQIDRTVAQNDPASFKQQVFRLGYDSFIEHGEEIFE